MEGHFLYLPPYVFQDNKGEWTKQGSICEIRPGQLSYRVNQDGRIFLRNRRLLRPEHPIKPINRNTIKMSSDFLSHQQKQPHPQKQSEDKSVFLRRSPRLHNQISANVY